VFLVIDAPFEIRRYDGAGREEVTGSGKNSGVT
jgi:hypothetical protein